MICGHEKSLGPSVCRHVKFTEYIAGELNINQREGYIDKWLVGLLTKIPNGVLHLIRAGQPDPSSPVDITIGFKP